MTKYVGLQLDGLTKIQEDLVNAVINEGQMRAKEEILEKIERKITEMYAQNDLEMVEFLEQLIRDLDLDL